MHLPVCDVSDTLGLGRLHMMRNRNAIISLIAALLLLGLIIIEPHRFHSSDRKFTHYDGLYSTVAVSSTVVLAESKPRMDSFDASSLLSVLFSECVLHPNLADFLQPQSIKLCVVPQPLWLLNRSLLI